MTTSHHVAVVVLDHDTTPARIDLTLQSIRAQGLAESTCEIVLADLASEVPTAQRLIEADVDDTNVAHLRQDDPSPLATTLRLVRTLVPEADMIALIEAGDMMWDQRLDIQVKVLHELTEIDVLSTGVRLVSVAPDGSHMVKGPTFTSDVPDDATPAVLAWSNPVLTTTVAMRADVVDDMIDVGAHWGTWFALAQRRTVVVVKHPTTDMEAERTGVDRLRDARISARNGAQAYRRDEMAAMWRDAGLAPGLYERWARVLTSDELIGVATSDVMAAAIRPEAREIFFAQVEAINAARTKTSTDD